MGQGGEQLDDGVSVISRKLRMDRVGRAKGPRVRASGEDCSRLTGESRGNDAQVS